MDQTSALILFASGVSIGTVLAFVFLLKREQYIIESALDTVGIRRKEFNKLKSEVEKIWDVLQHKE